jgi:pyruvate,water dikinase
MGSRWISNQLFIVAAGNHSFRKDHNKLTEYVMNTSGDSNFKRNRSGDQIGTGRVKTMYSLDKRLTDGNEFKAVMLVTDMTDPDWEPS